MQSQTSRHEIIILFFCYYSIPIFYKYGAIILQIFSLILSILERCAKRQTNIYLAQGEAAPAGLQLAAGNYYYYYYYCHCYLHCL